MKSLWPSFPCLALFMTLLIQPAKAQWIQQLSVYPAVPVSTAPVSIVASLAFPSGDCFEKMLNVTQVSPDRFEASALHCLGLLTVICTDNDSFDLGVLPPGNYRFVLKLDAGALPAPCTATLPTKYDSLDFTVTVPGSVIEKQFRDFSFFPNPVSSILHVSFHHAPVGGSLSIQSVSGKELKTYTVHSESAQVDLSDLPEGVYLIALKSDGYTRDCRKLFVSRRE